MSLLRREDRVVAPSVKMSLGIGKRPCSKGSRLGCNSNVVAAVVVAAAAGGSVEDVDVDGSTESVISM